MKKGWVTGEELTVYLERELELVFSRDARKLSGGWGPRASGMEMSFNAQALPGKRLTSVKVNGEEVEKNRKYTIAGREREGDDSSSNGRISLEAEDNQTNPGTAVTRDRFPRCRVQSGPTAGFFQSLALLPLCS